MQIIALSPSRNSQQVWLKFDNGTYLPFHLDDLVILNLSKFKDISPDLYFEIQKKSVYFCLLEYCLRQISISAKTQKILTQKLSQYKSKLIFKYNFSSDLIDSQIPLVIDKIINLNLLDSQKYIDSFIRKHPRKSQMEIKYLLEMRGVKYTPKIDTVAEITKIKNIISKKYSRLDLSDYKIKSKVIAKLSHLGFPVYCVKTAIDESFKVR